MTDKIQTVEDAENNKGRSELNIGGRKKNKKGLIIAVFIAFSALVLFLGIYFAVSNVTEKEVITTPADTNFAAGAAKSSLNDSNNYFESLRKEKLRKDKIEQEREQEREKERLIKAAIENKIARKTEAINAPKQITRTGVTPSRRQPDPKPVSTSSNNRNRPPTPEQRKMSGQVLINVGGSRTPLSAPSSTYSQSFNAFSFENGKAGLRKKGGLDFLLIHGTSLPCALYTQIISDYEGFVTCRITQDVYSANGAALLVEKGSLVSGTQSVAMVQGKARIFTSWADIETPLGASIRIDSLGAGQLGAAGIDAWVDNHFKERFGGAILLSFVDDALGALGDRLADKGDVEFDNSTKNGSDMAAKALEGSINIQPTGYAFIGQKINILVARDIDMSSIYHFEAGE